MAEFSKEYIEKYDKSLGEGSFSINDAKYLQNGFYLPLVCEGYGFIAVGKVSDEICLGYYLDSSLPQTYDNICWVPQRNLDEFHQLRISTDFLTNGDISWTTQPVTGILLINAGTDSTGRPIHIKSFYRVGRIKSNGKLIILPTISENYLFNIMLKQLDKLN